MKKSILSTLVITSLALTSCANQTSPVVLEKFYRLGFSCDDKEFENTYSPNGFLDVAWGSPVFLLAFSITGVEEFTQPELTVGETVLEPENRNQAIIRQAVIRYRPSRPLGASLPEYVVPYTGPTGSNLTGILQVISPELARALTDSLAPNNDFSDVVDVNVDVYFEGEMSRSRSRVTTATVTYPIRAYKSAPTLSCANGYRRFGVDTATGAVSCVYRGQEFLQGSPPPTPNECCPAAGDPGC